MKYYNFQKIFWRAAIVLAWTGLISCASDTADRTEKKEYLHVVQMSPTPGSAVAGIKEEIRVVFDRSILPPDISRISFRRKEFLNELPFHLRADASPDSIWLQPDADLMPGKEYSLTLKGICASGSICLQKNYASDFTVDSLEILFTDPAQNSASVGMNSSITITLEEPLANLANLSQQISMVKVSDQTPVVYDLSINQDGTVIKLDPLNLLSANEEYLVRLSGLCSPDWKCLPEDFLLKFQVSSSNWGEWTQITANPATVPVASASALSFQNRIWLFGGYTTENQNQIRSNRIDSFHPTTSGWTQVLPAGIIWKERTDHATEVFSGKMYLFGGETDFFNNLNTIWQTSDGIHWSSNSVVPAWSKRFGHRTASFQGKLWLSGGFDNSQYFNDLYETSDGFTWSSVDASFDATFDARSHHGFLATDNHLWIFGGRGNKGNLNDVWRSENGKDWERITENAPWDARDSFCAISRKNVLYLIAGNNSGGPLAETWKSADGKNWSKAASQTLYQPRFAASCILHEDTIYLIGGRDSNTLHQDIWKMAGY